MATASNGYGAQILRIRDSAGTIVSGGSINVSAGDEAKTIAGNLNSVSGVSAVATSEVTLSSWAKASTSGTVTLTVGSQTVVTAQAWGSYTQSQAFGALRDAINNNSTLSGQGYAAAMDTAGNLKVTNSEGRNIYMKIAAVSGALTMNATGTDVARNAAGLTSAGSDNISVGGRLEISLPEGYTIESSTAGNSAAVAGIFNAAASTQAKNIVNNVDYGNAVAAQTITINGAASASVLVSQDDSAEIIAQKVNTVTATTGVTADARTQAKISSVSAAGTIGFTLFGSNTTGVAISGAVTGSNDLAAARRHRSRSPASPSRSTPLAAASARRTPRPPRSTTAASASPAPIRRSSAARCSSAPPAPSTSAPISRAPVFR
ncbi:MAG: hypothetical protein HZC24_02270 [Rhodocyclales bacterium]|nr:hypothetical protein [Rhodocyclales bacterium]